MFKNSCLAREGDFRLLTEAVVPIARNLISDLSSKLATWRAKCKKNVFRLFSFAIFDFKSRLDSKKRLGFSPSESHRCAE